MTNTAISFLQTIELDIVQGKHQNREAFSKQEDSSDGLDLSFLSSLVEKFIRGDYLKILRDVAVQEIIGRRCDSSVPLEDFIKSRIIAYLKENNYDYSCQIVILVIAVASLQLFVQNNWTGPLTTELEVLPILSHEFASNQQLNEWAQNQLSTYGEHIYNLVRYPQTLLFAKIILNDLNNQLNMCQTRKWWLLRYLSIHQFTLLEKLPTLYSVLVETIEESKNFHFLKEEHNCWHIKVQFYVELALISLHYHDVNKARYFLNLAQNMSGLNIQLSGALGTRTYFQQKPLPQLLLKVKRSDKGNDLCVLNDSSVDISSKLSIKNLRLHDDTVRNEVKFLNEVENMVEKLYPEEQVVILALGSLARKSLSPDDLMVEELMTYLNFLLSQTTVWCIQMQCLRLRCQLEKCNARRIERAMTQMQELVDAIGKKEDAPSFARLHLFYCTQVPPYWMMEKELGELLLSLGANKSALDIFLRLELWEDAIVCYQRINRRDKAEALIRQLLESQDTPLLWCLLGDVTDDPSCYMKAWELSCHRSARAQRSLGNLYFMKKEYKESIPYFENSLEINSLQIEVWFSLAYAATQAEEYELAAKAYRRVVGLDSDNFEAWNNLSNAYIKMNQKQRAWKALQEALKCNYEEWKVWENYLLVCIDVGGFEDAIKSWHRLIDIKGKHMDEEILTILVKAVLDDVLDVYGLPGSRLKKKVLELLGRITSTLTTSAVAWHLYARLCAFSTDKDDKQAMERALQYLQRAHRCLIQKPRWEKDPSLCKNVLLHTNELAEAFLTFEETFSDLNLSKQLLSSAKFMLKGVIIPISKSLEVGLFQNDVSEELKALMIPLNEHLEKIEMKSV